MVQIKIYSKVPCPYCVSAKNLLKSLGLAYEEIDLTHQPSELEQIKQETGWRTVPIILVDGKLIGGYTDLKALVDQGRFP